MNDRRIHSLTVVQVDAETFAADCACGWRSMKCHTREQAAGMSCDVLIAELEGSKRRAAQRVLQTA